MTNTINNVPRELLERVLYLMDNYIGTTHPEEDEIRAILSAPSPAGVDGLNVKRLGIAGVRSLIECGDGELARYSDVERLLAIIDGLRGEVGAQRVKTCAALKARNDAREERDSFQRAGIRAVEERDQQAQRIAELEGLLRESYSFLPSAFTDLLYRIDAALSAGNEPKQCT